MNPIKTINGAWSEQDNAWVSETLCLTGDCWLEVDLQKKGRLVIKKAEEEEGPYPKVLISNWTGPQFKVNIYGTTKERYIIIFLTSEPKSIQYANI